MRLFVIRWLGPANTPYDSERYALTAKEALALFRRDIAILKSQRIVGADAITITGVHDASWQSDYVNGGRGVYLQVVGI